MSSEGEMLDTIVPLVSVSVVTYNHEKYVRQCLDGILMQKIDFSYEILVHDDASSDGTADIIREYETKYPEIIKPIYQKDNQFSQGKDITKFNIDRARGKFLAFCDGDDYWTDPEKLQKQVDFLETHLEYIGAVHRVKAINGHDVVIHAPQFSDVVEHVFSMDEYARHTLPSQLSSWVIRNVFLTLDPHILDLYYSCKANGDEKLSLLLVIIGNIYCSSEDMSTYRRITSEGSSWNAQIKGKNRAYPKYKQVEALLKFAEDAFDVKMPESILYNTLIGAVVTGVRNPNLSNLKIVVDIALDMPNKRSMILYHLTRIPYYIRWIATAARLEN